MRRRPEKERLIAESLFVIEGKSGREIAALLSAGKETVQRWAREGQWTARRRRRRLDGSSMATVERLKRERDRLTATLGAAKPAAPGGDDPAAPAVGETISLIQKLTQTIEKMESQQEDYDVGAMLATMGRFAKYVVAHATDQERLAMRSMIEKFLDEEHRKSL